MTCKRCEFYTRAYDIAVSTVRVYPGQMSYLALNDYETGVLYLYSKSLRLSAPRELAV